MTPWLDWLLEYKGQYQKTGGKPSPFVESIFKHTTFGPLHGVTPACCAATLCAALEESGLKSTHSAAAISYKNFGIGCELKPGAILVFEWSIGKHHVTVCDHIVDQDNVMCIGGNQGDFLQEKAYPRSKIIATRWPEET